MKLYDYYALAAWALGMVMGYGINIPTPTHTDLDCVTRTFKLMQLKQEGVEDVFK